jgi:drug/metabolite transporter (DMT)-like permease
MLNPLVIAAILLGFIGWIVLLMSDFIEKMRSSPWWEQLAIGATFVSVTALVVVVVFL